MTQTNLRMVICSEFGTDDMQKMFGIFSCKDSKPCVLDLNYKGWNCKSGECKYPRQRSFGPEEGKFEGSQLKEQDDLADLSFSMF